MYQKEFTDNFRRDNIARLTFGDLSSEINSNNDIALSEVNLLLTPMTLSAMEQQFASFHEMTDIERDVESRQSSTINISDQTMYSECSYDSYDDDDTTSNSADNWMVAGGKVKKMSNGKRELTEVGMDETTMTRRLPGPRPSCRDEEMTPEELERRRKRRVRNKTAAAKCRQRRVDQTNELLTETKNLETEAQNLEKEIATLERLKHQLEFVLEAHKPMCKAEGLSILFNNTVQTLKTETQDMPISNSASRPTSLPIIAMTSMAPVSCSNQTTSSQFNFDFSSTGLTPFADASLFLNSTDLTSPSIFLLSPSSLLAQ